MEPIFKIDSRNLFSLEPSFGYRNIANFLSCDNLDKNQWVYLCKIGKHHILYNSVSVWQNIVNFENGRVTDFRIMMKTWSWIFQTLVSIRGRCSCRSPQVDLFSTYDASWKRKEFWSFTLCEKCSYLEFFWSLFPRIYSLRIQSECQKIQSRKTPNRDTFHAVSFFWNSSWYRCKTLFKIVGKKVPQWNYIGIFWAE